MPYLQLSLRLRMEQKSTGNKPLGFRVPVTLMESHPERAVAESRGRFWAMPGHKDGIRSVAVSPDGMQIVSVGNDTTLCVYDAYTGAMIRVLEAHPDRRLPVAVSAVGATMVSPGSDHKTVRV